MQDGAALDAGLDRQAQEIGRGGEGVFGVDRQPGRERQVVVVAHAGTGGDPGDVQRAGVVPAVAGDLPAVVGGDDDERIVVNASS